MKTLILRTFAHSNIWEGIENSCHFELAQKKQILEWEPDYMNFKSEDFDRAIGIYTEKYFSGYFDSNRNFKIADSGTNNEKVISEIRIHSEKSLPFPFFDNDKRVCIPIEFQRKLWETPNKNLMMKIDDNLIKAKIAEMNNKGIKVRNTQYFPLSFSLDSKTVEHILENTKV